MCMQVISISIDTDCPLDRDNSLVWITVGTVDPGFGVREDRWRREEDSYLLSPHDGEVPYDWGLIGG